MEMNKVLYPTIRITTKCTQKCRHCAFECSPERSDFMEIEEAKEISKFLRNNGITQINLMGGEFVQHPNWSTVTSWRDLICSKSTVELMLP